MLEDKYDLMSKMVMRLIKVPMKKGNEKVNRGKGSVREAGSNSTLVARVL